MGFEDQRRKLLTDCRDWGDDTQVLGSSSTAQRARENQLAYDPSVETVPFKLEDALDAADGMNRILSLLPPPISSISTEGWTLKKLLDSSPNFVAVPRTSALSAKLLKTIQNYDEDSIPLIIEGCHQHPNWPHEQFNVEYFGSHTADEISVRNVRDWTDRRIPFAEFIAKSRSASPFTSLAERERLYGKDVQCPEDYNKWLHNGGVIPNFLLQYGPTDLFAYTPKSENVETLMCYLGIGDTYTPCHKDLCASSGQNLMCYTENGGSSFWFMTEGFSAPDAALYFQRLQQELDHETHVISVEDLAKAPFKVYIAEQKLGDLILVPPRSCHQVVNYGGITLKTSWSRMTLKGIRTAYYHELPIYQRVCRPETYRVKNTIHYALSRQANELQALLNPKNQYKSTLSESRSSSSINNHPISHSRRDSPHLAQSEICLREKLVKSLITLLEVFDHILVDEYSPDHAEMTIGNCSTTAAAAAGRPNDGINYISCDFCGADVFQSFFECRFCVDQSSADSEPDGGYIICPGCYVEGRSCKCEVMEPMQYQRFENVLKDRRKVVALLVESKKFNALIPAFKTESDLLNDTKIGRFRAACGLLQMRHLSQKENRMCSAFRGTLGYSSHSTSYTSTLNCKECHCSKCFPHILTEQRIHPAEAILYHISDSKHVQYHENHRGSKARFNRGLDDLKRSQRHGTRPHSLHIQFAFNALTFVNCKPVNFFFMKLGWFDVSAELREQETSHQEAVSGVVGADEVMIASSLSSPLSSCPSSPAAGFNVLELADLSTNTSRLFESTSDSAIPKTTVESIHGPRKKQRLSVWVDIPPLPRAYLHSRSKGLPLSLGSQDHIISEKSRPTARPRSKQQISASADTNATSTMDLTDVSPAKLPPKKALKLNRPVKTPSSASHLSNVNDVPRMVRDAVTGERQHWPAKTALFPLERQVHSRFLHSATTSEKKIDHSLAEVLNSALCQNSESSSKSQARQFNLKRPYEVATDDNNPTGMMKPQISAKPSRMFKKRRNSDLSHQEESSKQQTSSATLPDRMSTPQLERPHRVGGEIDTILTASTNPLESVILSETLEIKQQVFGIQSQLHQLQLSQQKPINEMLKMITHLGITHNISQTQTEQQAHHHNDPQIAGKPSTSTQHSDFIISHQGSHSAPISRSRRSDGKRQSRSRTSSSSQYTRDVNHLRKRVEPTIQLERRSWDRPSGNDAVQLSRDMSLGHPQRNMEELEHGMDNRRTVQRSKREKNRHRNVRDQRIGYANRKSTRSLGRPNTINDFNVSNRPNSRIQPVSRPSNRLRSASHEEVIPDSEASDSEARYPFYEGNKPASQSYTESSTSQVDRLVINTKRRSWQQESRDVEMNTDATWEDGYEQTETQELVHYRLLPECESQMQEFFSLEHNPWNES